MKTLKNINTKKYAWLIAYIDVEHIHRVQRDLKKFPEYKNVEAFIPTVKIIKKVHKGKNKLEEVPLLFNYGFFKVPRIFAVHPAYLENMQKNIACLVHWVKDPMKTVTSKMLAKKVKKKSIPDTRIPVAVATSEEIAELLKDSFDYSAHSSGDLEKLKPGDFIVLRGHPWEGVKAEFISIDHTKREAKVKIEIFDSFTEVKVAWDNIFFTIYHSKNYDDSLSTTDSLDQMGEFSKINKKLYKQYQNEQD